MSYDPEPAYPPVSGGEVEVGFGPLAEEVVASGPRIVAVDGPAAVDWEELAGRLSVTAGEPDLSFLDIREHFLPWPEVERRTTSAVLRDDPVFARLAATPLEELVRPPDVTGATVVFGPGSALVDHDLLWYVDVPKRHTLDAVNAGTAPNLGQPPGSSGSERRHLFIDWPILDRHRDRIAPGIDRFIDATELARPRSIDGEALRASLRRLAGRPFRVRPTFRAGSWGGQWLRRRLGVEAHGANVAWSFELIAPESGLLLGSGEERLEVPFSLLVAQEPGSLLGEEIGTRFGGTFPVRFDYLDTVDGGDLSVHCHPRADYMREVFGWAYTQHESYYLMEAGPGARVFLGLRGDLDVARFREEARRAEQEGVPFEVDRYVGAHPAEKHRLYLIPAGTPHGSGEGNVVLEISATPYLYSLRFYDWLREGPDGSLRPVHLRHAFANLDLDRRGGAVRALMPTPQRLRSGDGFVEWLLGSLPELFFEVRRTDLRGEAHDDTAGRFHVLNLVEGDELRVETEAGAEHRLAYAETLLVPASVGRYRLVSDGASKVVKALVP